MVRFDKFTDGARRVLTFAQELRLSAAPLEDGPGETFLRGEIDLRG